MVRKFLFAFAALLLCSIGARAQTTHYSCGYSSNGTTVTTPTSLPATFGYGWSIPNCDAYDVTTGAASTVGGAMTNSVTAGNWLIAIDDQCPFGFVGDSCTQSSPQGPLINSDSLGNGAVGTVNTNGTTVTWVSGIPFSMAGCTWSSACDWHGLTITINGTGYTISTDNSQFSLTLTTSAGVQTKVSYSVPHWSCTETWEGQGGDWTQCIAKVTTSGADTVTLNGPTGTALSESIAEVSNTNGILAEDASSCPLWNCGAWFGYIASGTTQISQTVNPQASGELIITGMNYAGSASLNINAGWTPLNLDNSQGPDTQVQVQTSAGLITVNYSITAGNDSTGSSAVALIPGGSPASTLFGPSQIFANAQLLATGPSATTTNVGLVNYGGVAITTGALTLTYQGGSPGSSINDPLLEWSPGWLVLAPCTDYAAVTQNTLTDSTGHNTWAAGTGLNYHGDAGYNYVWWTIVASNGFGPEPSLTCNLSGATNEYMGVGVLAFASSTGWPATPLDRNGTATVSSSGTSITASASAQNTNAVEVETAHCVSAGGILTSYSAGWTLQNVDQYNEFWDFWRISSALETASITLSYSTAGATDCIIDTWKTN